MLDKDPVKRYSSSECLEIIPPQYKHFEANDTNSRNFYDFSPLFFGIDIPNIPSDLKKTSKQFGVFSTLLLSITLIFLFIFLVSDSIIPSCQSPIDHI